MKNVLLILSLLMLSTSFSMGKGKLTINYSFSHIEEGYDHIAKCQVYIDGVLVEETKQHKQSVDQSFRLKIPKGKHHFRIVILALYEGNWEEHIISNDYSTDAYYEGDLDFHKKNELTLAFDLDKPQPSVAIKN